MRATVKTMLLCLFLIVIGVSALWSGLRLRADRAEKEKWPVTRGRLLERNLVTAHYGVDSRGNYKAQLKYTYEVNGKEYTGTELYSRTETRLHDQMKNIVDALPAEPEVHYNPADPSQSYLLVSSWFFGPLAIFMGVISLLWAAGILLIRFFGK